MRAILDYERIDSEKIHRAIRTEGDEFVICRSPFRWMRDGEVVSNAYEMFDMESVCSERDWEIVARYGDSLAVVKPIKEGGGP